MPIALPTIADHLNATDHAAGLRALFLHHLNWALGTIAPRVVTLADLPTPIRVEPLAELGGIAVLLVRWPSPILPTVTQRRAVLHQIQPVAREHVACYVTDDGRRLAFVWARNRRGKTELRTLPYEVGSLARTTLERLAFLHFEFDQLGMFGPPPSVVLDRLNTAFDAEAVSKQFFREYGRMFNHARSLISGVAGDQAQLFTQTLFNRLMFLVFLERKGWLEFAGSRQYLRALWDAHQRERAADPSLNFYASRLSLLFFSGLNAPHDVNVNFRADPGSVLVQQIGRVPYLNGGLFEQDALDRLPDVHVPDAALREAIEGLFYRFNFTVTESTPLDVEVAVDPEMLGKIFEELVTDRHDSGSYYTPKPIVAFMCREGLKGFLGSRLPHEDEAALRRFVDDHNAEDVRDPEQVLAALQQVRVCDPACGSGAYLLGMLHELLELRAALFVVKKLDYQRVYDRKLDIIQRNIYGVDLDPFAVNIARLRLWLSLMIEYEGVAPPPLPNLDYKIEVGDSLATPDPQSRDVQPMRQQLVAQFQANKDTFIDYHGGDKRAKRGEIDDLKAAIREITDGAPSNGGFDWAVDFAEVFPGGFDIVVANPPYVRMELFKEIKPLLRRNFGAVHSERADLYVYFYARALELLRDGGMLAFISPNKWFRAGYGANLRRYVAAHSSIRSITDFGELPVFATAATFPMIFITQRGTAAHAPRFTQVKTLDEPYPDVRELIATQGNLLPADAINGANWTLADAGGATFLRTMDRAGMTLERYVDGKIFYGVKTGFNNAFVIDGAKRAALIAEDQRSAEIIKPLAVGDDVRRWYIRERDRWLIYAYHGVNANNYPAIIDHLSQYRSGLEGRATQQEWYELQQPQVKYSREFDKSKIIFPDIAKESRFAFDTAGTYISNTTYFIPVDDLYLLGVLNSASIWSYAKESMTVLGDAEKGGRLRFFRQFVQNLPIPDAPAAERQVISGLVEHCLAARGQGVDEIEAQINERVAWLYGV